MVMWWIHKWNNVIQTVIKMFYCLFLLLSGWFGKQHLYLYTLYKIKFICLPFWPARYFFLFTIFVVLKVPYTLASLYSLIFQSIWLSVDYQAFCLLYKLYRYLVLMRVKHTNKKQLWCFYNARCWIGFSSFS